jgi:hypothetical protein
VKQEDKGEDGDDNDDNDDNTDNSMDTIFENQYEYWKNALRQRNAKFEECSQNICGKEELNNLIQDVQVYLNRITAKNNRLIGNFTTNLCESCMSIRAQFDGGKFVNRC